MKYFKFYPADFLLGVQHLTNYEAGIYIKMLCYQWDKGAIPTDKIQFKNLFNADMPDSLLSKFLISEDKKSYINEKLHTQRNESLNKINTLKNNGSKGAQVRWSNSSLIDKNFLEPEAKRIYFKIKNELIEETPSEYLKKWHGSFIDLQAMRSKINLDLITDVLNDVFTSFDSEYSFYDFSSQNHLKNAFKAILNKNVSTKINSNAKMNIHGSVNFD
jgi:hypothetical protein